jgi:dTDP-glucose pyrophosphorylase
MAPRTCIDDWAAITLDEKDSFASVLELINRGGYQLALVLRDNGSLAGMITDSDIRKALLRGIGLDQPATTIMNSSPLVVSPDLGEMEAHRLMRLNHFFHLPIVNDRGQLVGLHVAEQLCKLETYREPLVIMAGGRGKRLMPLTAKVPKPMLPIGGKPMLERIITKSKAEGFSTIILSVNYLADVIINHFGDGSDFGVNINYLREDRPLGTAGALAAIKEMDYPLDHIVVANADIVSSVSFAEILGQAKKDKVDGLMAVKKHQWQNPYGVVHVRGANIVSIEEKPVHSFQVNAGIYVIGKKLLSLLEVDKYFDMPDLFCSGIQAGLNLSAFPMHEAWDDVGLPNDFDRVSASFDGIDILETNSKF